METEVRAEDTCGGVNGGQAHSQDLHENLVDPSTAARLAQTFKALSDPTRVRIISALLGCELCVHELAAVLGMTHSAISHQLGTLRDMRLVKFRKEGRHVFYTLDDEHIHDLFRQGLEHIRHE